MKKGSTHFIAQRLSALLLIPLIIWFCFFLAKLPGLNHEQLYVWLQVPSNAILLTITLLLGLFHGRLGVQVVLEDYVSSPTSLALAMTVLRLTTWLAALAALFFIFRVLTGSHT